MFKRTTAVPALSRYERVSRRALLQRSLAAGVGAVAIAACAKSDADTFGSATASAGTDPGTTAPSATATTDSALPTTTSAPPAADSAPDPAPSGDRAIAEGLALVTTFTYEQAPGGKDQPPYVAVWLEDADGDLVETIELWHLQSREGLRWLPDLRRWFGVDQARIATGGVDDIDVVSGATRLAGSYDVEWDGVAESGPIPTGSYHLCIESARENGPHSLIRVPIVLDGAPFDVVLPSDGELTRASVALIA